MSELKKKFTIAWQWVKAKWIGLLVLLGIAGLGAMSMLGGPVAPPYPSVIVNGELIEFPYTDNLSGENIHIYSDKETYGGWKEVTTYLALVNQTGSVQSADLRIFNANDNVTIKSITKLQKDVEVTEKVKVYEKDCKQDAKSTSTICTNVEKGTKDEIRLVDEWQPLTVQKITANKTNLKSKEKALYTIQPNSTEYFKVVFSFPNEIKEEFIVETNGNNGGFGNLDPSINSNWNNYFPITSSSTLVATNESNFPYMYNCKNAPGGFWSGAQANGGDIRITTTTASNADFLDYELVSFSATSTACEIYFRDDTSSTTAKTYYVNYGNSGAVSAATTSVWNSNFKVVVHGQSTSTDSTVNIANGVDTGSPTSTTGILNGARKYHNSTKTIHSSPSYARADTFTFGGWVNMVSISANGGRVLSLQGADTGDFSVNLTVDGVSKYIGNNNRTNQANSQFAFADGVSANTFHHVYLTSDGSTLFGYLDGVFEGSIGMVAAGSSDGQFGETDEYGNVGTMSQPTIVDEARLMSGQVSNGWIKTDFNMTNSSSTFWSAGGETSRAGVVPRGRPVYNID